MNTLTMRLAFTAVAFTMLFAAASVFASSPDNVWQGPLPEACFDIYDPVYDKDGSEYSNQCFAAMAGVRLTWNNPQ